MKTPICDFAREYEKRDALRLHMPGHKGKGAFGFEALDITEIEGADSLYEANGIIAESERVAGELFGAHTFYSAEGSSLCIRAMLDLAMLYAGECGSNMRILAARNAHRVFLSAVALLDIDVSWIEPGEEDSYLSCAPDAKTLDRLLSSSEHGFAAVYITSPDYLGRVADIKGLAEVCHRHKTLMLVDNAHGAYLKFLPDSLHPMDMGADMCCDSAHKTLPALTGAAYLHISKSADAFLKENARSALAMFGSTSPSYLILQSLDRVNAYICDGYADKLRELVALSDKLKRKLSEHGYVLFGDEPLKLTICPKSYGYEGRELADILLTKNIVCEFSDRDFLVMMLSAEFGSMELNTISDALMSVVRREPITERAPTVSIPKKAMSVREAAFSARETVPAEQAEGRILAAASVACPPAVPVIVCGERIDGQALAAFRYYGITECSVVKDTFSRSRD